jgi:uncharacterized protein
MATALMKWPTGLENIAGGMPWVGFAAFLEALWYLTLASPKLRARWSAWSLVALAPLPYLLYAVPCGVFRWESLAAIVAVVALAAWFLKAPAGGRWSEFGFILLMAAPPLFGLFKRIYAPTQEGLRMDFLGQLMWIRVGILSYERTRGLDGLGFGFWPKASEWKTGAIWYAALLPVAFAVAELTGFAQISWPANDWPQVAAVALLTFAGGFWVVALGEEFLFRGLLQRWMGGAVGNERAGWVAASTLFGLAHLGFRQFPNWRFVIVAAVAGLFYGEAFRRSGSLRAAMVAHALTITTWRTFFR